MDKAWEGGDEKKNTKHYSGISAIISKKLLWAKYMYSSILPPNSHEQSRNNLKRNDQDLAKMFN